MFLQKLLFSLCILHQLTCITADFDGADQRADCSGGYNGLISCDFDRRKCRTMTYSGSNNTSGWIWAQDSKERPFEGNWQRSTANINEDGGYVYITSSDSLRSYVSIKEILSLSAKSICIDLEYATIFKSDMPIDINIYINVGSGQGRFDLVKITHFSIGQQQWQNIGRSCCLPDHNQKRELVFEVSMPPYTTFGIGNIQVQHSKRECEYNENQCISIPHHKGVKQATHTTFPNFFAKTTEPPAQVDITKTIPIVWLTAATFMNDTELTTTAPKTEDFYHKNMTASSSNQTDDEVANVNETTFQIETTPTHSPNTTFPQTSQTPTQVDITKNIPAARLTATTFLNDAVLTTTAPTAEDFYHKNMTASSSNQTDYEVANVNETTSQIETTPTHSRNTTFPQTSQTPTPSQNKSTPESEDAPKQSSGRENCWDTQGKKCDIIGDCHFLNSICANITVSKWTWTNNSKQLGLQENESNGLIIASINSEPAKIIIHLPNDIKEFQLKFKLVASERTAIILKTYLMQGDSNITAIFHEHKLNITGQFLGQSEIFYGISPKKDHYSIVIAVEGTATTQEEDEIILGLDDLSIEGAPLESTAGTSGTFLQEHNPSDQTVKPSSQVETDTKHNQSQTGGDIAAVEFEVVSTPIPLQATSFDKPKDDKSHATPSLISTQFLAIVIGSTVGFVFLLFFTIMVVVRVRKNRTTGKVARQVDLLEDTSTSPYANRTSSELSSFNNIPRPKVKYDTEEENSSVFVNDVYYSIN